MYDCSEIFYVQEVKEKKTREWKERKSKDDHSGQTHDACAFSAIILQKKIQTNVESFTLNAKSNAVSENLSFLLSACVQNEVTGFHKF